MANETQRNDMPNPLPVHGRAAAGPPPPVVSKQQANWIVGGVLLGALLIIIVGYSQSSNPDPEKFGEAIGRMLIPALVLVYLVSNDRTRLAGVALAVIGGVGVLVGMGMGLAHPHKPTIAQMAAEANKQCPKQLDANTRMDAITSAGDKELVYHYTVTGIDDDAVVGAKDQIEAIASTALKSSQAGKLLVGDDVTCIYVNTSGKEILRFTMHM